MQQFPTPTVLLILPVLGSSAATYIEDVSLNTFLSNELAENRSFFNCVFSVLLIKKWVNSVLLASGLFFNLFFFFFINTHTKKITCLFSRSHYSSIFLFLKMSKLCFHDVCSVTSYFL